MPTVMENSDRIKAVANVCSAKSVWFEDVVGTSLTVSIGIPKTGAYRVILLPAQELPECVHEQPRQNEFRIGSMKDEISLPEDFDEVFDSLDNQVSTLFSGAVE